MAERPFPTDKPSREASGRKGIIRARVTAQVYIVDFGTPDGAAEMAHWSGSTMLDRGTFVRASWANEMGSWVINYVTAQD